MYEASVSINGKVKNAPSTFFPKDWSPEQVVEAIEEAYNSMEYTGRRNAYRGMCNSGIEIELYIDDRTNEIISAYPIMK